jgi:pilus assembly protein Flp/PilA
MNSLFNKIENRKGQSLIEYLVLVCLIAVGSMAVIRVLGKNVRVQFANVSRALGGDSDSLKYEKVSSDDYSKRDFSDFMKGAGSSNADSSRSNEKKY